MQKGQSQVMINTIEVQELGCQTLFFKLTLPH